MTIFTTFICKINTFYGAYAPEFNVCAYATCQDEALNNLREELAAARASQVPAMARRGRGESHAR